ncbi:hypothetical protein ABK040_015987 [Willaertia magna]
MKFIVILSFLLAINTFFLLSNMFVHGYDHGEQVVDSALDILQNKLQWLNSNTRLFMKRVALVESHYGNDPNTYRSGYYGGIWQVDNISFQDTQQPNSHPALKAKFTELYDKLGIIWMERKWTDCTTPLYSLLAARLNLFNIPAAIPTSLADQAYYWKKFYNTNAGKGTVEYFISECKKGGLG